jgi:hypothetical protein
MKTSIALSILISSLSFATLSGQASAATPDNHVTQTQIDALHSAESSSDVIAALGKPDNTTRWMDGTHSLAYETYDAMEGRQTVYVDLDSGNKVIDVQVLPIND